jgi:peroxiredoxin
MGVVSRQRKRTLFFVAALVVLVGAGLWYQTAPRQTPANAPAGAAGTLPEVGKPAPPFQLTDLSGKRVTLADFKGRPIYLNFWATWCRFCQQEFPDLEAAWRDYGRSGQIVFLAIDSGEGRAVVRQYLKRNGFTLPALLDQDGEVSQRYLVQGLPTSYFIGRNGVIRDKVVGALDRDGLRTRLEALLQ